jgi:hypothetical protein
MFPVISLALAVNETIQYYDTGAPTTDQNNGSSATAVKPVIDGWLVAAGCVIVVAIIAQYISIASVIINVSNIMNTLRRI